ncbi:ubiquinone/menaquinone biosynthesis C-methylase UbiE [Granulicella aggregans]|uniref:Ubiquinone/menaquinone biosynthesis C-methylase UbiE n=1 Tax=Granulicella aggregans TaxID=474949 RepID=A0A7W7ZE47_9BACT|nr:class I SAM-dependent methyltransferase [Granulicella aggregans]MBB5058117.1 ubiquinone/menaquinone biosynthesis C-methylase UbiE [Granulicella aggregans]
MSDSSRENYVFGQSIFEQERLLFQGRFLRPYTEHYFRAAGLSVGMRVLDVGCGVGDVAFLAADIVGPGGRVTCIDRDSMSIKRAQERASQQGCSSWVEFQTSTLDEFASEEKYDALIGRYILLYLPDPAATLRHLIRFLNRGAIVAFHDVDIPIEQPSYPPCPLFDQLYSLVTQAFLKSGAKPDFGRRLGGTFLQAGLPFPTIESNGIVGGGRASYVYGWLANSMISIAPLLHRLGLTPPEGIALDANLAGLLEKEAVETGSQLLATVQYGAWARVD